MFRNVTPSLPDWRTNAPNGGRCGLQAAAGFSYVAFCLKNSMSSTGTNGTERGVSYTGAPGFMILVQPVYHSGLFFSFSSINIRVRFWPDLAHFPTVKHLNTMTSDKYDIGIGFIEAMKWVLKNRALSRIYI